MGNPNEILATLSPAQQTVAGLVARARTAQAVAARYTQSQLDELVTAAGWAIMAPAHNQALKNGVRHDLIWCLTPFLCLFSQSSAGSQYENPL